MDCSYFGPHTDQCLYNVQSQAGFVDEAWLNPKNLTRDEKKYFNSLNLKYEFSSFVYGITSE